MFVTKIKTLALVLTLGFVATGTTILANRLTAGPDDKKSVTEKPVEQTGGKAQKKEKQAFIAWGKGIDGLQAGLSVLPDEKRTYHPGETVTLVIRVRNIGKDEVKFQYIKEFLIENPPTVVGTNGKTISQGKLDAPGLIQVAQDALLAPGKEIEISSEQYQLVSTSEREQGYSGKFLPLWVEPDGKCGLQYERLFGNTSAGRIKVNPELLKLATGNLEFDIKPAPEKK